MIKLKSDYLRSLDRTSSKGNQLKWLKDGFWYKADNRGYEALSEYVISKLLSKSSLNKSEYVDYDLDLAKYKHQTYNVCKSENFLKETSKLITLERLFESIKGVGLTKLLLEMNTVKDRIDYVIKNVELYTGIRNFGEYLSKILIIDKIFLNDDRHMNNIAIVQDKEGKFSLSPIFDNGAALLSDIEVDYPLSHPVSELIPEVRSKSFSDDFDIQIDYFEEKYGLAMSFMYDENDILNIVDGISQYPEEIKNRVKQILLYQRNKNIYYFE